MILFVVAEILQRGLSRFEEWRKKTEENCPNREQHYRGYRGEEMQAMDGGRLTSSQGKYFCSKCHLVYHGPRGSAAVERDIEIASRPMTI